MEYTGWTHRRDKLPGGGSAANHLGCLWGFPKMVGFPNKPMGFPTKNDHFGVFPKIGVPQNGW